MNEPRHCDDYIKDKSQPKCLRKYLLSNRLPAYLKYEEKTKRRLGGIPKLYATLASDLGKEFAVHGKTVKKGTRVRIVMASRLGDVGITTDLSAENGYSHRIPVEYLSEFSEVPHAPS